MLHKGKVKSAFKWQVLNISLQAILQFVFIMLSARVLPKEIHGAFAIINSFVFVLSITSEGGVSNALIQRQDINKNHVSISFYITMFLSLFMFLSIAGFSKPIAQFYDEKVTATELVWASLIFIFKAWGSVSRAFLIRDFKFKQLFVSNNLSFFLGNIVMMYVLSKLGFGIYALIFGFIGTQFFQSMLYFYYAKHSLRWHWRKEEFNQIFKFGSGFMLLKITNYVSAQIDKLLIGKYFSVTALSIYEKGQFISKMPPKYVGNSMDAIMFSAFSKINDLKQKNKYFAQIVMAVMTAVTFFAVWWYYNATVLVRFILGDNWLDAVPYLEIFAFVMPAIILGRLGDIIVRSENKMFSGIPIKLGFMTGIIASVFMFKDKDLLLLTVMVVIVFWLHGFAMLALSWHILKSKIRQYYLAILAPIAVGLFFGVKNYLLRFLTTNDLYLTGIIILSDALIIGVALYIFRDHPMLKSALAQIKSKISKLRN
ncbi:MAG: oligosaccharide flippase family protein [Gilvibacter sp.]